MKNLILIFLVSLLAFSSCCKIDEEHLFCDVQDPINELTWLKEKIDTLHAKYSGEVKVFRIIYGENNLQAFKVYRCPDTPGFPPCHFASDFIWYNCEGEIICQMKYAFCPVISDSLTHMKLIYKE